MSNNDNNSRRPIDIVALLVAFALLAIAAIGISGTTRWVIPNLLPWAGAGVVALVGLGLILSSLPHRRRR